MERIIGIYVGGFFNVWALIYTCSKILDKNINYKDKWFWILSIFLSLYIGICYNTINVFIRMSTSIFILILINMKLFKKTIVESSIASFLSNTLIFISEMLCVLFLTAVLGINLADINKKYFATFTTNLMISTIQCFLININHIKNIMNKIILNSSNYIKNNVLFIGLLSVITFIILVISLYFKTTNQWMVLFNLSLIIIYSILAIIIFQSKSENIALEQNYNLLMENLSEYEKLYARERMHSHENRNELMIIRGMVKDKIAIEYIDEILNFKINENNNWLDKLKTIPNGGLQGLLYCKFCIMENKKISVDFSLTNTSDIAELISMNNDLQAKICKIVAIFIDNSIEAVEKVKKPSIRVSINNCNNYFQIKIANNYKNKFEVDKIYEQGYSTKSNQRGHGLKIVKEIIDSDKRISNKIKISGCFFEQVIIIDKKTHQI